MGATVQTALKLFDGMTRPISNINQGMNVMISTMQKMQSATDKNLNIDKSLIVAKQKIASAESDINKSIQDATKQQNNFNNSVKNGKKESGDLLSTIKGLATAYLSIQGLKGMFNSAWGMVTEEMAGGTQETKLAQVLNTRMGLGTDQIESFTKKLKKMGKEGSLSYGTLISGAGELATYMTNEEALLKSIDTMSNMAAAQYGTKTTDEQFYNLATGVGKVFSGQAGGLSRQGWILDDSDVKVFEKGNDMQKAATFADLAADSYGEMNKVIAATPENKVRQLNDLTNELRWSIGRNLMPAFLYATQEISARIDGLLSSGKIDEFFTNVGHAIGTFVSLVADAVDWGATIIVENMEIVKAVLTAVGVVVLALAVRWLIMWVAAAWPVFAVIAVLAIVIFWLNYIGVSTQQIIGVVVATFNVLYTSIYNIIAWIYNGWADFAEFFANVFNHPVYSVKKLFVNFATSTLSIIGDLAKGIDAVFGSNLAGGLTSLQNKMSDWLGEMPEGYKVTGRMETKSVIDAAVNGYDAGSGFANGISDKLKNFNPKGLAGFVPGDGVTDIGSVDKVKKVEGKVDISSEDLKTMRELAEMKNIQNFVTLTPTVNMTTGPVSKDMDVGEIMNRIKETIEEDIAASAAGVYGN